MKKMLFIAIAAIIFTACTNNTASTSSGTSTDSTSMSQEAKEERNKETALAAQRSFEEGKANVDSIFQNAAPDLIDYNTGEMPATKGVDSTKAFLKELLIAFPDYRVTDVTAVADGDYVMVSGTWSGTWKNDFMGMKATGKSFKLKDVDIFKFNDEGKITEHHGIQSMNEMGRQIGMQMPEPPKQ
jgi:predicted ester cyclase